MAFGQQSGPPSSARQVDEISRLLESVGFASLREARHPYGLTQRQASGKFTQTEADELIERLRSELDDGALESDAGPPELGSRTRPSTGRADVPVARSRPTAADRAAQREADRRAEALAAMPDDALADELVRRGWMCMPPA